MLQQRAPPKSFIYKRPTLLKFNHSFTVETVGKEKEKDVSIAAQLLKRLFVKDSGSSMAGKESQSLQQTGFKRYPKVFTKETISALLD